MKILAYLAGLCALVAPLAGHAWWNGDWSNRARVTLDAGPAGADLKAPLSQVPVLVRLHSGNFEFARAKPDGSDLRFVSADDKTPLKHHVEKWDPANDVALVWVLVPAIGTDAAANALWLYSGNPKATSADDAKGVFDAQHAIVFHFEENEDHAGQALERTSASIIGDGAKFAGGDGLLVQPSPPLRLSAAGGVTLSAWVKVDAPGKSVLLAVGDKGQRVALELDGLALAGVIEARGGAARASGGALRPGAWHHVALAAGRSVAVYLDGAEVASAKAEVPEITGPAQIARGFTGEMDEVAVSTTARSADWIRAAARGQGPDAAFVNFGEPEGGSAGASYIGILLGAVTLDGWVVIAFLGVMFAVSVWVMAAKTVYVNRNERENHRFLDAFHNGTELLGLPDAMRDSSLSHVYRAGAGEIKARINGSAAADVKLSPKAVESIRTALDAARVRESQKLNRFMVLLTIAISGGPFLGLLGTVIGVMITFAAIAATGDVNVAAIAPGIAAALVATVAGLGVAIPALFAYNYIGTRIKNIGADMQVFADEFLARVAERYEA